MSLNHAGNDYAARLAEQSRTPKEHQVPPRTYYHHHNYAKFIFDLGGSRVKASSFANYRYDTDDKREQDQLDLVADVPGTFIYTIRDSEVAHALADERNLEAARSVMQAAAAAAAVNNQPFDPNAPIIPVNVAQVQASPHLQIQQVQQPPAVVGLQNSVSGTQATEPLSGAPAATKTAPPSAADAAAERLAQMAKNVGAAKT